MAAAKPYPRAAEHRLWFHMRPLNTPEDCALAEPTCSRGQGADLLETRVWDGLSDRVPNIGPAAIRLVLGHRHDVDLGRAQAGAGYDGGDKIDGSAVTAFTAFDTASSGAPASINAASSMSPAKPAVASIQACRPTSGGVTRPTVDGAPSTNCWSVPTRGWLTTSLLAERCGRHWPASRCTARWSGRDRLSTWLGVGGRGCLPGTSREGIPPARAIRVGLVAGSGRSSSSVI